MNDNVEPKLIKCHIYYIDEGGWGFMDSMEIPFTRIHFHWKGLRGDTLRFQDLEEGMFVECYVKESFDENKKSKGYSAYKIRVLEPSEYPPKIVNE